VADRARARQIRDAYAPLRPPPRNAAGEAGRTSGAAGQPSSAPRLPSAENPLQVCCLSAHDPTVQRLRPRHAHRRLEPPPFGQVPLPHGRRCSAFSQPQDTPAEQFAAWLPYSAYLSAEKLFVNRDSVGFMLEVMPQSGADERMAEVLISLYSTCPPGTGIQFHLFASPHIRDQLRRYANLRVEDTDQAEKARALGPAGAQRQPVPPLARQRVGHLLQGRRHR
jgi:hypothetical protein